MIRSDTVLLNPTRCIKPNMMEPSCEYKIRQLQHILTPLIGVDRDDRHLTRERAHVRDAVKGLDLKGVVGVCREVRDSDGGVG